MLEENILFGCYNNITPNQLMLEENILFGRYNNVTPNRGLHIYAYDRMRNAKSHRDGTLVSNYYCLQIAIHLKLNSPILV